MADKLASTFLNQKIWLIDAFLNNNCHKNTLLRAVLNQKSHKFLLNLFQKKLRKFYESQLNGDKTHKSMIRRGIHLVVVLAKWVMRFLVVGLRRRQSSSQSIIPHQGFARSLQQNKPNSLEDNRVVLFRNCNQKMDKN